MPPPPPDACVSVVMPCYNEEPTIGEILARVLDQPVVGEVIVVDDGSTDRTGEVVAKLAAEESRVRVLRLPRNLGKGAALRRGLGEANRDFVVIQDADLDYDPADYDRLLTPLRDGRADVCYGSRFQAQGVRGVHYYWHAVGNAILTTASNMATNLNLTDMGTCYKAFRRDVIQAIDIEEDRFGFEPEITAKLARGRYRVYETGISSSGRTHEGRKTDWRDGLHALRCILRYNLWPGSERPRPVHEPAPFDEADEELVDVLTSLEGATNYTDWIVRLFAPYLGDEVLEIGAGHGTVARRLAELAHVTATDPSTDCLEVMRRTFGQDERIDVTRFDLLADEPLATFDSVVLANVLEHLPDDVAALRRVGDLLVPGGAALVFVPALEVLYADFDRRIGHHRRYHRRDLGRRAREAGLVVSELRYVNPLGAVGWLVGVRGLGRFPKAATVGAYDRHVVPRLEALERRWRPPFGQSLFLAAHRPLA